MKKTTEQTSKKQYSKRAKCNSVKLGPVAER